MTTESPAMERWALGELERDARRIGMTRREFMLSTCGAAVALLLDACIRRSGPVGKTTAPAQCVLAANDRALNPLGLAWRQYVYWDSDIEDPLDEKGFLRSETQFLNIKFAPRVGWEKGQHALWGEIASGAEDARAALWAEKLKRVRRTLAIALHHEPIPRASGGGEGLASDLVAAVARVVTIWKAAGVHHLLGQCLVDGVFRSHAQDDKLAMDVLDIVGVDGYGITSEGLFTASEVFDPALAFAKAHDKPLVIFETSFKRARTGQQRVYFESLDAYLKGNPEIIGCALYLYGENALNAEGLSVVTRMASDPYYSRLF